MADPRLFVCGGLPASRRAGVRRLNVGDGPNDVRLRLDRVSAALGSRLDDVLADLLEAAAFVYAADQAEGRGGGREFEYGERWRRDLRFRIPVRRPDVWNRPAVRAALVEALGFLSDDDYAFEFVPHPNPADPGRYLTDACPPDAAAFDGVMLFSGGLDSLAGAADEVLARRRVVLVSHQPESRVTGRQRQLARALAGRAAAGARPYHLQVTVNKGDGLNREFTQRTRSFLFAAIAASAARQLGLARVRFYENGVTSLNLPVNGELVGARASRTTHPRTLALLGRLFSLLFDSPFEVDNPYQWTTKAEVVGRLRSAGLGHLVRVARSCAHTWAQEAAHPHCGRCSQCVDRWLAGLAAGLGDADDPPSGYALNMALGERAGSDLTFAERYAAQAVDLEGMGTVLAFAEAYPEVALAAPHLGLPAGAAVERAFDLYRRHAAGVRDALALVHARHVDVVPLQAYPARSLLGVVVGRVPRPEPAAGRPAADPRSGAGPVADPERFEVRHGEATCFLGNTLEFRLAERLIRAREGYVSVDTLLDDVWQNPQTAGNTVQRTVSNLRRRFKRTGLGRLVIDGRQPGHYRLFAAAATSPSA